jgi:hypothetical protein
LLLELDTEKTPLMTAPKLKEIVAGEVISLMNLHPLLLMVGV